MRNLTKLMRTIFIALLMTLATQAGADEQINTML